LRQRQESGSGTRNLHVAASVPNARDVTPDHPSGVTPGVLWRPRVSAARTMFFFRAAPFLWDLILAAGQ